VSRSPKLGLYGVLAATSFLVALALGRPELAALGAPFVFVLVVGLALSPPAEIEASLRPARALAVEGDELEAELVVSATRAQQVQLALHLPDGVRPRDDPATFLLRVEAGSPRALPLRLVCAHWGAHRLGDLVVRTSDRAGLRSLDRRVAGERVVRVYPRSERLQSLIAPVETQPFAGNRVARAKGEGIEFADVRPYVPGDRVRRINWRQSAFRQALYVNQQHPERNSDVVLSRLAVEPLTLFEDDELRRELRRRRGRRLRTRFPTASQLEKRVRGRFSSHIAPPTDAPPPEEELDENAIMTDAAARQVRDLSLLRGLVPHKARVLFALQPLAPYTGKRLSPEEEELFALLDMLQPNRWPELSHLLETQWGAYTGLLKQGCAEVGVPFIDLGQGEYEGWCFIDRIHSTDRGYDTAAELLEEALSLEKR
jgi:hypothetical protein